jgi:hypothetical protein
MDSFKEIKPEKKNSDEQTRHGGQEDNRDSIETDEDLNAAREQAEVQLAAIEQKMAQQRKELEKSFKEKENESISLRMQLETVNRQMKKNRENREQELKSIQIQVKKELDELDRKLRSKIKEWQRRIKFKQRQLDEMSGKNAVEKAQSKLEQENKEREIKAQIEELQNQIESANRKFQEEQDICLQQTNTKEEDIVKLKTQIAIIEAQSRSEEEKHQEILREFKKKWEAQSRTLETMFNEKSEELKEGYQGKENELIAFRIAAQQSQSDLMLEYDSRTKELGMLRDNLLDKVRGLEEKISKESAEWQDELKARKEEYNQLKVQVMLKETEEKARQEKAKRALAEEEKRARMQMGAIEQKINEIKEKYRNEIVAKDQELEATKIQAEVKLKSLYQQYEGKQAEIVGSKNELTDRIHQLETELSMQKELRQQQLQAKNEEIEKFKQERQLRQQMLQDESERNIEELKAKRKSLGNELAALEEIYVSEKDKWQKATAEKDKESENLSKEIEEEQSTLKSKIEVLEKEVQKEQSPLIAQIDTLKIKIHEQRGLNRQELARKEQFIKFLAEDYAHKKSDLEERYNVKLQGIEQKKNDTEKRVSVLKNDLNEYIGRMESNLARKENEIKELRSEIETRQKEYNLIKQTKIKESEEAKKPLQEQIEVLSGELAEIQSESERIIRLKEQDKEISENKIVELEKLWNNKIEKINQDWVREKMVLESEQEDITRRFSEEKLMWDGKISELTALQHDIKSREALHKEELSKLEKDSAKERVSLEDKKRILAEEIDKVKAEGKEKLRVVDPEIQKLKEKINERTIESNNITEEKNRAIAEERAGYSVQFDNIRKDMKTHEDWARQVIKEKEAQIAQLQKNFEQSVSNIALKKEKIENERIELKLKLEKEIVTLEGKLSESRQELVLQVKAKEDEIELFSGKVNIYDVEIKEKKKRMGRFLNAFNRRAGRKISQLEKQLADAKEYWKEEIDAKENDLKRLTSECDTKKQELQAKFESDTAEFAEERHKLEKQQAEIENKIRDIGANLTEEINIKDKQIIDLREKIAEKEIAWHNERKKIQRQFARERNMLTGEMNLLQDRLKSEGDTHNTKLKKIKKQIEAFKTQAQSRLRSFSKEYDSRINELDEANRRLGNSVADLEGKYDKLKVDSEETRRMKLQELDALKNEFRLKEAEFKDGKEKIEHENLKVCESMQNEISGLEQRIKIQLGEFNNLYEQKENEFLRYQAEAKSKEDQLNAQFAKIESQLVAKREELTRELELLERKLKAEGFAWSKEKQGLEEHVEKLSLGLAIKDSVFESERSKIEHDIKKGQRRLESKISDLKRKFDSDSEYWNMKIRAKEEEMNILKIRTATRDERMISENEKRKKELDRIVGELQDEVSDLDRKYGQDKSKYGEEIKLLQEQSAGFQDEINRSKNAWESQQKKKYIRIKDSELTKLENEIKNIEKSSIEAIDSLKKVYEGKIREISMLTENILSKDEQLKEEQKFSQEFVRTMKNKIYAIRDRFKPKIIVNKLVDEGIKAYDIGEYDKAIKIFTELLSQDPTLDFAYQYLAVCYKNLGLKDNALEYAKKSLEFDPESEFLKDFIEEL